MIDPLVTIIAAIIVALAVAVPGWLIYRRTRDMFVVWIASPFCAVMGMAAAHHFLSLAVLR